MYKDPTEFRARFKAYKEGKMPYENGLPKFAGGTPGLVNPYTLPLLQEFEGFKDSVYLDGKGIPTIGWGFTDSSLVNKGKISRKEADAELQRLAGNVESNLISKLGIDNWKQMSPESQAALISYAYNYPAGFKDATNFMKLWRAGKYWDAIDEVDAGMYDKANPGLKKRRLKEQSYLRKDPFFLATSSAPTKKTDAELKIPIINKTDATTINKVIPQEQTHTTWEGAQYVSPYLTGKPMLRPIHRVQLPNLVELMDDSEWEPSIPGLKNGKLPRYRGGKTVIGSNVNMNDDGTFTDDYTRDFEDIVITPKGPRVKAGQLYKYQEPWDDEKFLNAVTVGGLNNLSPAQWARRAYDVVTGNLTTESWLNGNAGIVPTKYAEEHPNATMAANALFDFWTLGGPSLLKNALQVGKLNPVSYAKYEPQPIVETKPTTVLIQPKSYLIEDIPGYQLKTLMRGNQLEKQLSKSGTISTNSIQAQANKASEVEKAVINKVLQREEFAGQKTIDYNRFRKAVHDELIEYDVIPDARYEDYGLERLGISTKPIYQDEPDMIDRYNDIITRIHDFELQHYVPRITRRSTEEEIAAARAWRQSAEGQQYHALQTEYDQFYREHPNFTTVNLQLNARLRLVGHSGDGAKLNTYTFSSDKIPVGNAKHYDSNTLGHSRTYTTETEPEVLHVMESQSDWGLNFDKHHGVVSLNNKSPHPLFGDVMSDTYIPPQHQYLANNYTYRQIQENLKYAAEHGQTKMRYPTPETAAKIEGYPPVRRPFKNGVELDPREFADNQNTIIYDDFVYPEDIEVRNVYRPEHRTILKKYLDFPKQFKKLHKNTEVREVIDTKGNTWYEVDVPKDFLKKEWMYGMSIPTVVGAGLSLNANGKLPSYSNGKISIKPANRGKLTRLKARTGKSESELYNDGNPAHKKMVVFARNARKWKH